MDDLSQMERAIVEGPPIAACGKPAKRSRRGRERGYFSTASPDFKPSMLLVDALGCQ